MQQELQTATGQRFNMTDSYDVSRKKRRRVQFADPWYERLMWELPNLADGRKPELSVICQYPDWTNPGDGCTMFKGVLCPLINPETDEPIPPPTEEELEPVVFFKLVMKGTFAAENEHRAYKRMRRSEDNWPDRNVHKLIDELQVTNKHKTMVAHVKFRCFVLELVPYTMADFYDQVLAKSTIPLWETERVEQLRLNISQGLFMQMLYGLNYLHRQGILHGNIRPECILLDDSALHLKISDFSQAQLLTDGQGELRKPSKLQVIQGTYGYKAPEVIAEDRSSYDFKTDMFSAGCVLADMVLGKWCIFKEMDSEKIREGDKLRQLEVMKKCHEDIPLINLAIHRIDFGVLVSRLLDFKLEERWSVSQAYHSKFFRMLDPLSRKVRRRIKKIKREKRISVENIPMVLSTARSTRLVSALNIDNPIKKFVPTATIPLEPVEHMHRRTDLNYEIVGSKMANPDIGEQMRLRKAQQERLREERHEERERLLTKEKERKERVRLAKVRAERELEEAKRRSQKEVDYFKELAEQVEQRDAEKAAATAAKEAEQGEKDIGVGKEKETDKEAVGGEEVAEDEKLVAAEGAPKEAGVLERVPKDLEEGKTDMDEKTEAKLEEKKAEELKEETKLEKRGGEKPSSDKPSPEKGSSATGKKTEVLSGAGKRKFLPSLRVWQPAQKKGEKKGGERESPRKVQFATQVQKTAAPKSKEPGSPRKPPTARASAHSTASTPKEATPRLPPVKKQAAGSQRASAKKPSSAQVLSTSRPKLPSWRQKRREEEARQVTPQKKGTWRLEDSIVSPRLKKKQVPEKEPDLLMKCQELLAKSAELDRISEAQGTVSASSTKQPVEFTDISSLPEWKSPSPPSSPRDRKPLAKSAVARSLPKQPSAAKSQSSGRTSSSRYLQRDPKLAGKKEAPQRLTGKPPSAKNLATIPESKSPLPPASPRQPGGRPTTIPSKKQAPASKDRSTATGKKPPSPPSSPRSPKDPKPPGGGAGVVSNVGKQLSQQKSSSATGTVAPSSSVHSEHPSPEKPHEEEKEDLKKEKIFCKVERMDDTVGGCEQPGEEDASAKEKEKPDVPMSAVSIVLDPGPDMSAQPAASSGMPPSPGMLSPHYEPGETGSTLTVGFGTVSHETPSDMPGQQCNTSKQAQASSSIPGKSETKPASSSGRAGQGSRQSTPSGKSSETKSRVQAATPQPQSKTGGVGSRTSTKPEPKPSARTDARSPAPSAPVQTTRSVAGSTSRPRTSSSSAARPRPVGGSPSSRSSHVSLGSTGSQRSASGRERTGSQPSPTSRPGSRADTSAKRDTQRSATSRQGSPQVTHAQQARFRPVTRGVEPAGAVQRGKATSSSAARPLQRSDRAASEPSPSPRAKSRMHTRANTKPRAASVSKEAAEREASLRNIGILPMPEIMQRYERKLRLIVPQWELVDNDKENSAQDVEPKQSDDMEGTAEGEVTIANVDEEKEKYQEEAAAAGGEEKKKEEKDRQRDPSESSKEKPEDRGSEGGDEGSSVAP